MNGFICKSTEPLCGKCQSEMNYEAMKEQGTESGTSQATGEQKTGTTEMGNENPVQKKQMAFVPFQACVFHTT